jgi:hypothetical protein
VLFSFYQCRARAAHSAEFDVQDIQAGKSVQVWAHQQLPGEPSAQQRSVAQACRSSVQAELVSSAQSLVGGTLVHVWQKTTRYAASCHITLCMSHCRGELAHVSARPQSDDLHLHGHQAMGNAPGTQKIVDAAKVFSVL